MLSALALSTSAAVLASTQVTGNGVIGAGVIKIMAFLCLVAIAFALVKFNRKPGPRSGAARARRSSSGPGRRAP